MLLIRQRLEGYPNGYGAELASDKTCLVQFCHMDIFVHYEALNLYTMSEISRHDCTIER
jgi:hypothetical protein